MHSKRKISDYTFQKTTNLFNEEVVMVLENNKHKKHIVSLGKNHREEMIKSNLNPDDNNDILVFLENNNYL
jgi:DNA polymerase III delta subunit